ncbi:MAG: DUF2851 family protein [Bacteroidales bacterium]|nr:MAG: DUF2851 family protein [Bacteroidales bacterium]
MKEDLLYFIWKTSYFTFNGQTTTDGELVEVIHPGEFNSDSGPDFFNAKIRIGNTIWAGNVEFHINSSDWLNHNHQADSAYDNVILHVVVNNDKLVENSKGRAIPTLKIKYPDALEWNLMRLTSSGKWIPCEESFTSFDSFTQRMWLECLLVERLEQKTKYVFELVDSAQGSWEEAFYQSVARSFGLKANALPFELLAKAIPLKVLAKHKDNLFQIEALLFGQSGLLLEVESADSYTSALLKEYQYLQHKFNLTPIQTHLWKFLRMRPTAFPTIRIAQFAKLIHSSTSLFSKIIEINDDKEIVKLFQVHTSEYWENHYIFDKKSASIEKRIGKDTISIIAINSLVPFIFAYGINKGNSSLKSKATKLLESLKPEINSITKGFENLGVKPESAYDTQALIQLKTCYCDPKKCLYCHLGAKLLLKSIEIP